MLQIGKFFWQEVNPSGLVLRNFLPELRGIAERDSLPEVEDSGIFRPSMMLFRCGESPSHLRMVFFNPVYSHRQHFIISMQTIGDRLEEARKQKGISIREAAETTKIRGEYLSQFENNQFDINLPEIYVRGFLRNYARFLRLDGDQILIEYQNAQRGQNAFVPAPREAKEVLGRFDRSAEVEAPRQESAPDRSLKSRTARLTSFLREKKEPAAENIEESAREISSGPREAPVAATFSEGRRRKDESAPEADDYIPFDKTLYLKIGVGLAGAVVLVVLLLLLIAAFRSSPEPVIADNEDTTPEVVDTRGTQFFLLASGDISRVTVVEIQTNQELFSGPLGQGDEVALFRDGPVRITWTNGEFLRLRENDRTFSTGTNRPGQTVFPRS